MNEIYIDLAFGIVFVVVFFLYTNRKKEIKSNTHLDFTEQNIKNKQERV